MVRALTARQPPHRSWLIIQLGEPIERKVRARITLRREVGAAGGTDDRLRPVFAPHLRQPVRHLVERLVPGDARPFALAARARAAHGVEQAVGPVGDAGGAADAFDAEGALGIGVVAVGLEVDDAALADGGERPAAGGALPAGGRVGAIWGVLSAAAAVSAMMSAVPGTEFAQPCSLGSEPARPQAHAFPDQPKIAAIDCRSVVDRQWLEGDLRANKSPGRRPCWKPTSSSTPLRR